MTLFRHFWTHSAEAMVARVNQAVETYWQAVGNGLTGTALDVVRAAAIQAITAEGYAGCDAERYLARRPIRVKTKAALSPSNRKNPNVIRAPVQRDPMPTRGIPTP